MGTVKYNFKIGDLVRHHIKDLPTGGYLKILAIEGNIVAFNRAWESDVTWFHHDDFPTGNLLPVKKPNFKILDNIAVDDMLTDDDDDMITVLAVIGDIVCVSDTTSNARKSNDLVDAVRQLAETVSANSGSRVAIAGQIGGTGRSNIMASQRTIGGWLLRENLVLRGFRKAGE